MQLRNASTFNNLLVLELNILLNVYDESEVNENDKSEVSENDENEVNGN